MPIYEFECGSCRRKTTALVMSRERVSEVRCKHCGGADLERLWSRFAAPKSEEARLESLADPAALGGLDENDPASVARFMKKMGREMGEDAGPELDEAIEGSLGEGAPGDDDAAGGGSTGSDDL
ncbi:MAG: zinc ribbon domain-containing protein [Vicinamibacteria bacterium]